ncbi:MULTISPECIES: AAA family ATPase [unclassified Mesorhizobium]|uniref:AAA family ATPase n=1 Tax=unclassified Mesorhizobium TaxID=325217 RepID=UPI001CCF7683|nr:MULTISPECIES: MoxR family ATPase [unclassified Mesorhizobium]MBZ9919993.1 MoxR family ATPase [Mesorhizobium sp. BR1-1-7]MBZ9954820.1 MoxR family ATPase [Mesorhizobium sp. BR1-1-15]MBZ9970979.1 MoxR family ATPase [Mesorhizobium sp. BR1-1-12]
MTMLYPATPSTAPPSAPKPLPASPGAELRDPRKYRRDPGLVDAVNVSLLLRQPLMVTGEPGTGKTVLAVSVAFELGLDAPLAFETKSTSQARDLFYGYDTLGRFTAKELGSGAGRPADYITYNALGEAIVRANEPKAVQDVLPAGYVHPGKRRSVVLIDEVEKAPRDFPNDILNEIERMYFRIPELGNRAVEADPDHHPIVVITNNSEKSLPDAFLRRCIYYNIPFPDAESMEQIVLARLPGYFPKDAGLALIRDAVKFALFVRDEASGLDKKPGTSELLNWLSAMVRLGASPSTSLSDPAAREFARRSLPALAKISGDQSRVGDLLSRWRDGGRG